MTAPRYFAIFGAMRTGSNLLERTLGTYEGLVGLGELFNPHFIGSPDVKEAFGSAMADRNRDPVGFLERAIAAHRGRTIGFRIFDDHDWRLIDHAAGDPDCARVILTRDPLQSWLSLEIARKTGQWLLRKAEKRRLAKVEFDAAAFEAYRDGIAAHYARLRRAMRAAGRPWVEIGYDDLADLEAMNGIAAYLGSPERKPALDAPIERQNPPAAIDKIANPEVYLAWARAAGGAGPAAPAEVAPRFSALGSMFASRGVEVVCAPIPGVGDRAIRSFIEGAQEAKGRGDRPLAGAIKAKQIERRRARGTFVFSLIRHPADRIREVFARFARGEEAPDGLREALVTLYGASPRLDVEADFDAFLAFVADSARGRTATAHHPAWAAQADLLAAYAEETPIDFVARAERIGEDAPYILDRLGVADPDGALTKALGEALARPEAPALTPEREAKISEIYARDYARLGYARLTE